MADSYLVIGATGAQGGAVADRLVRAGHQVRGLTRSTAKPKSQGDIEWAVGDLADRAALVKAFDGVTHASVTLPMLYDRALVAGYVDNLIAAAKAGGVRRLVFNTSNRQPAARTPHDAFESRRDAAGAFLGSGVPTVVLRPPVYLENLCGPYVAPALVGDGVLGYPIAPGARVAWLAHDDLAAITVAAFGKDELVGSAIDVGGADQPTGPELAEAFAKALDRPVTYAAVPVDAFEAGLAQAFDPAIAAQVAAAYRLVGSAGGAGLYEGDPVKVEQTFGVRLTPVRDWIAAQPWQALA